MSEFHDICIPVISGHILRIANQKLRANVRVVQKMKGYVKAGARVSGLVKPFRLGDGLLVSSTRRRLTPVMLSSCDQT